jgi:hypothetical protein
VEHFGRLKRVNISFDLITSHPQILSSGQESPRPLTEHIKSTRHSIPFPGKIPFFAVKIDPSRCFFKHGVLVASMS